MGIELLLDLTAQSCGDRVALCSDEARVDFAELDRRARSGAVILREHQVRSVAFIGANGPVFPVAMFAAAHCGLPLIPLNFRLAPNELTALLDRLDDALIMVDDDLRHMVAGRSRVVSTSAWYESTDADGPFAAAADQTAPAVLLFTSGTTSTPKAVVLRHDNLVSYVLETVDALSAGDEECALVSLPPYHIAGVASVLSNVCAGRRVAYLRQFTAEAWLDSVRRHGVTSAMVVPTMLTRLVDHIGDRPADVPTLRSIAYGGARVSPRVLERALRLFPDVGFVNAYGLTETSSTIAVLGPHDHRQAFASEDPVVRGRLGSVGRAVQGIEFQVRGETGGVLGNDNVGELFVRGAQVSGEYVGQGVTLDADGWFGTRDRASIDLDGYVYIEGRGDDTIIRGGENVAPAEIEDVLMQHDGVVDAAVVGVPDEEWGQRIAAVVVVKFPGAADGLLEFARARLRSSKTPDILTVWSELPYSPTGKLLRRTIVAALVEAHEGAI